MATILADLLALIERLPPRLPVGEVVLQVSEYVPEGRLFRVVYPERFEPDQRPRWIMSAITRKELELLAIQGGWTDRDPVDAVLAAMCEVCFMKPEDLQSPRVRQPGLFDGFLGDCAS